ncbi:MAG TPA: ParB/RepB/Spo0J family partition protein [Sphingobacteriaceae bacterium]|nr:ParB/RepB/Spo0J family partition protein [Sphingobacteriaceae bacterium]
MAAQQRKIGLGKGLSALLNDSEEVLARPNTGSQKSPALSGNMPKDSDYPGPGGIYEIEINRIAVNPFQPRTDFDQEALEELADSIRMQGLIQPITVRQDASGNYQLISGERRLRASKLAGLNTIPAYIRTANDQQMLEMALIENIQRENLNAIEVALSFQRMIEELNLKQEELGERVSKNRSTVTNYLRLLRLPPVIQAAIRDGNLSMGHARALVNLPEVDQQLYVFREVLKNSLSVRKTEEIVREIQQGKNIKNSSGKTPAGLSFQYQKIEDDLASRFATRVKLKLQEKKGKGAIEIPFNSEDDLNRILELLDW